MEEKGWGPALLKHSAGRQRAPAQGLDPLIAEAVGKPVPAPDELNALLGMAQAQGFDQETDHIASSVQVDAGAGAPQQQDHANAATGRGAVKAPLCLAVPYCQAGYHFTRDNGARAAAGMTDMRRPGLAERSMALMITDECINCDVCEPDAMPQPGPSIWVKKSMRSTQQMHRMRGAF